MLTGFCEDIYLRKGKGRMIEDIFMRIRDAEDFIEVNHILDELMQEEPELIRRANNVYQYQDHMINTGLSFIMGAHAAGLQRVSQYGLSCAPELIVFRRLKNQTRCFLITRIPGMTDQPPMPWDMRPVGMPGREDFARVMDDVEALLSAHLFNTAMLERRTWNMLPSGQIIISDWSAVVTMPEKWEEKYRQQIKALCGM